MSLAQASVIDSSQYFADWMIRVDRILLAKCGLDSAELPEWDWIDAFVFGYSPKVAVKQYLDNHDM